MLKLEFIEAIENCRRNEALFVRNGIVRSVARHYSRTISLERERERESPRRLSLSHLASRLVDDRLRDDARDYKKNIIQDLTFRTLTFFTHRPVKRTFNVPLFRRSSL